MKNNIWCFWADENTMSSVRRNALHILQNSCKVDLTLVTNENYKDYESLDFPIHPAYEFLSDTHKSDYMRFYLTHNYGGGYADIKPFTFSWEPFYRLISDTTDLVGSPELSPEHIAYLDYQMYYRDLVSVHHFILKEKSAISTALMNSIHELLDSNYNILEKNPGHYHPRAISREFDKTGVFQPEQESYPGVTDYPLGWNHISGYVFHKVQYEHKERINKAMSPRFNAYHHSQYR